MAASLRSPLGISTLHPLHLALPDFAYSLLYGRSFALSSSPPIITQKPYCSEILIFQRVFERTEQGLVFIFQGPLTFQLPETTLHSNVSWIKLTEHWTVCDAIFATVTSFWHSFPDVSFYFQQFNVFVLFCLRLRAMIRRPFYKSQWLCFPKRSNAA